MGFLRKDIREDVIDFYQKLVNDNYNFKAREIQSCIELLAWLDKTTLPELENDIYISSKLNILFDDVQEYEDLTQEEKNQTIIKHFLEEKKELQKLLETVIDQMNIDYQKFVKEAEVNGYCPRLTEEQ